ncbi:hypothetical protein [Lysinibacillus xylanilyticus]
MCYAKISNSEQLKTCCELADQALYKAKRTVGQLLQKNWKFW